MGKTKEWTNKVICGNTLDLLKELDDDSIDMCITSPPYWSLRDYKINPLIWDGMPNCEHEWGANITKKTSDNYNDNFNERQGNSPGNKKQEHQQYGEINQGNFCTKCSAWKGSLGLEPTFDLYIKHLCNIFDEVKRVLKKEGTCWVNIGDTYYSISGGKFMNDNLGSKLATGNKLKSGKELEQKNLCNIPARFSIAMQDRGWILRNVIIWHKPNCMPSSVKDRFTVDFEYLFFFVKNKKYYFETQYELHKLESIERACRARVSAKLDAKQYAHSRKNDIL